MRKPSEIKIAKAKKTNLLLPGFKAITWMGTIYCKNEKDIGVINKTDGIDCILECHETIHIRQAESCNNSWFKFYLLCVWYYIKNLPLIFTGLRCPYYFVPFEIEAYANERDYNYVEGKSEQWKDFNNLPLKEKFRFAKMYKRSDNGFAYFARYVLLPYIKGR